jgi:hypothetical protein
VESSIGKLCAPDGAACGTNQFCVRDPANSARSVCTVDCSSQLDCPNHMGCREIDDPDSPGDKVKRCLPRPFCAPCVNDEQCGAGNLCIDHGNGDKFCSQPCRKSGSECPGYAVCADSGDGSGACVCKHPAGTCQGDGSLCSPCVPFTSGTCGDNPDAQCLTISGSDESFCSQPCGAGCPAGYGCTQDGNCMPANFDASKNFIPTSQKCVKKVVTQYSKPADIMEDFGMVGVFDTNADFNLADETPEILRLSDFAEGGRYAGEGKDYILVTVSAIWCGYCQQETSQFKAMLQTGKYNKLQIFQILYDGASPGTPIKMTNAMKQWIKPLKAQGAVGVDPDGITEHWIGLGSGPPLNILIDANTRKIITRINGSPQQGMGAWLDSVMK